MPVPNIANWIRTGLLALPVYGLLTFWSTLDPQPDQTKNPEAWARFVGSTSYLVDHMLGAIGGAVLAMLGVFALGALLPNGRAGRMGLVGMVFTVVGQALGLVIGGVSTFATTESGSGEAKGEG
jgi:MFS family permease